MGFDWIPDIRSHAILTGPDIRAYIKWPPRTLVLTSNDHPGHSFSYQITTPDIQAHINLISLIYSLHAYPLLLIAWSFKKKYKRTGKGLENIYFIWKAH